VDEVNLAFTVVDKRGHFVSNLQSRDFRLLDNKQEPRRLTFFSQRSDLPLHLALVIDASLSVKKRFNFERHTAQTFLKKILRRGVDKALVITFNDRATTIQEATDRADAAGSALRKVKPDGNTSLYDAVIFAAEKLRALPSPQITRRAIVLISDGVDTVKRSTLQEAEKAAIHGETMIFALSTNRPEDLSNVEGESVLKQLSASTGGSLLPARDEDRQVVVVVGVAVADAAAVDHHHVVQQRRPARLLHRLHLAQQKIEFTVAGGYSHILTPGCVSPRPAIPD
jgi:VWFA-related protein